MRHHPDEPDEQRDDLDAPLRYTTDSYVAPRRRIDPEPIYVDVLEALALLPREQPRQRADVRAANRERAP